MRLLLLLAALLASAPAHAQLKLAQGPTEAPFSLTASDGKGLRLVGLKADAVVEGPLAFTELRLVFENPHPRRIEGQFKVVLPDHAAISRFAMKIRGAWMEGEVVEKQAARRAYEDALHRRQDPALLEQDAGNSFRARVFPIEANERKELIISWSQELRDAAAYRLPLKGLPEIESLALRVLRRTTSAAGTSSLGGTASGYQVQAVEKQNWTPDQDWVVQQPAHHALRHENLALARVTVPGNVGAVRLPEAVLLVDTSASRAVDFAQRMAGVAALVARLPALGVETVELIAFDQSATSLWRGAPADFAQQGQAALVAREALGASDLGAALDAVAASRRTGRRVILFGDGVITAGERGREVLRTKVASLAAAGIERLDVVVDTTARDSGMLDALVTGGLPQAGKVIEGRAPLDAQLQRLERATLGRIDIAVPGAKWSWPTHLEGLQPGDEMLVYADLPATQPLQVNLSGGATHTATPKATKVARPLLHRAWIAARIRKLQDQRTAGDIDLKAALRSQIIALSTRHRVLSPYTALVVLETEADYRRFNIDRKALADILVVGATGVEVTARKTLVIARPTPRPRPRPVRRPMKRAKAASRGARRAAAPAPTAKVAASVAANRFADDAEAEPVPMAEPAPAPGAAAQIMAENEETVAPADEPPPARGRRRPRPFPVVAPPRPKRRPPAEGRREYDEIMRGKPALTGKMAEIDALLAKGQAKAALAKARAWRAEAPTDLLPLVALGRALAATGQRAEAARAFGSLLDLYPSRADMRRVAGNWLESLGEAGLTLAADTYNVARTQRPDHPSVYHQLTFALLKQNQPQAAFEMAVEGMKARRVHTRFPGVDRILAEDAGLAAAAWIAAEPTRADEIRKRAAERNVRIDERPTLRFVLTWETDANDVDFHIFDKDYGHAFFRRKALASGGDLYADVTRGYGPECFTIADPKAAPYTLKAHYYSRGPMGYGAGKLQVIRHDGRGHLAFDERPFVIMNDGAYVDLGAVGQQTAPLPKAK